MCSSRSDRRLPEWRGEKHPFQLEIRCLPQAVVMNLNRRVGEATTRLGDATSAYHEQGFGSRIGFGERPALVIVDMQRDFVDPDAPTTCAPMAQERLPAIRSLLETARTATIPVFFTQGLVRRDLSDLGLWKGPHGQGRVQIEGTPGAEIVPELARLPSE